MYDLVTLLYSRNEHNTVNQLYFNKFFKCLNQKKKKLFQKWWQATDFQGNGNPEFIISFHRFEGSEDWFSITGRGSGVPEHALAEQSLKSAVPNLFGTRDQFRGRQFFHGPGRVGAGRDGFGMIQGHYIYCALSFYYYYIVIYNEIIIQLTIMLTGGRM